MTLFIPFLILLALALAIHLIFNLSSMEAIFASVATLIISLLILTYVFSLSIAIYIFCICTTGLLLYGMIVSFKKNTILKQLMDFFSNPAFVIFVVSLGAYSFIVKDMFLSQLDNFSHWATSTKAILAYNGFNMPAGLLPTGQHLGMAIFNAFVTFFTGYKEGYMVSGMWFVYWASLLLPVSKMKWKKMPLVVIYFFVVYTILIQMSAIRVGLLCDSMIAVIAGSLVSYYYVNKANEKNKSTLWIVLCGMAILPHIKSASGLLFALFAFSAIMIDIYYKNKKLDKSVRLFAGLSAFVLVFASVLNSIIQNRFAALVLPDTSIPNASVGWCDPVGSMLGALTSKIGVLLVIVIIGLLALSIVLKAKKQKLSTLAFVFTGAAAFALIGYIGIRLDAGTKMVIVEFIKHAIRLEFYNVNVFKLVLYVGVYCILFYTYIVKDSKKANVRSQATVFIVQAILYVVSVIFAYTTFRMVVVQSGGSINRYLNSFVCYISIVLLGVIGCNDGIYKNLKYKLLAVSVVVLFIISYCFPQPLTVYGYVHSVPYEESKNYEMKVCADRIDGDTSESDNIAYVMDERQGRLSVEMYMLMYHTLKPLSSDYILINKNMANRATYSTEKVYEVAPTAQELEQLIIEQGFTKLFIYNLSPESWQMYSCLFQDDDLAPDGSIYEVMVDDDSIELQLLARGQSSDVVSE